MSPSSVESYSLSSSDSPVQIPIRVNISKSKGKSLSDAKFNTKTNTLISSSKSIALGSSLKSSKVNNALEILAKLQEKYKPKIEAIKPKVISLTLAPSSTKLKADTIEAAEPPLKPKETIVDALVQSELVKSVHSAVYDPEYEDVDYESDFESNSDDSGNDQEIHNEDSSTRSSIHTDVGSGTEQNIAVPSANGKKRFETHLKDKITDFSQPFQQKILDIEDLPIVEEDVVSIRRDSSTLESEASQVRVADWVTKNLTNEESSGSFEDDVEIEEELEEVQDCLQEETILHSEIIKDVPTVSQKVSNGLAKSLLTQQNVNVRTETDLSASKHKVASSTTDITDGRTSASKSESNETNRSRNDSFTNGTCEGEKSLRKKLSNSAKVSRSSEGDHKVKVKGADVYQKLYNEGERRSGPRITQPRFEALKLSWDLDDTPPSDDLRFDSSGMFEHLSPELLNQVMEHHRPMEEAIDRMLKQQVRLTRHFMASQYKMYLNHSDAVRMIADDYRPITLEETKRFIFLQRTARREESAHSRLATGST